MTMTPQPTDKLDAATLVAVNGPADDALLNDERIVRPHATGPTAACLSRMLGNGHALVLRGARHSNVPGLPVQSSTLHLDRFERRDAQWRFVERRIRTDLVGYVSRHLRRSAADK